MKKTLSIGLFSFLFSISAISQTREKGPWWPHPIWGAGDQAGASNWITDKKVLESIRLVETGKVYELGHLYEAGMPLSGTRTFAFMIPSFPTHGPTGEDKVVFNDEFVATQIGQVGTQFDGLGHPGRRIKMGDGTVTDVFYNGFNNAEMNNSGGLLKLGIEHVKPIITKGILIDVAGFIGTTPLADAYEVSLTQVLGALKKQGVDETKIALGDALLFNFGWWKHWPAQFIMDGKRRPRVSMEVIQWVIKKQPSMVGSDAILDGDIFNAHVELTMKNGIFNLEFMDFGKVLLEKKSQFLFIFTPVKFKGATGSPGNPIAIF